LRRGVNVKKQRDAVLVRDIDSIAEIRPRKFEDGMGNETWRLSVDIGLTVDERISDGFYCSRSVVLLHKLLENPELLERPLGEKVEF